MKKDIPNVYNGQDHYIFISYAHKDSDVVFKFAKKLEERRYNFWLDTGLEYGREWDEQLANKIKNASLLVFMASNNSIISKNCLDELDYARNKGVNIVNIILDKKVTFSEQFEFRYGRYQMCKAFEFESLDKVIDSLEKKCENFINNKKRFESNVIKENKHTVVDEPQNETPYFKIDKKGFLTKYTGEDEEIILPDSVLTIWSYAFNNVKKPIKKLFISKNVKDVGGLFGPIREIVVDQDNPYFTSIDGNLYSKDLKKLVKYPEWKHEVTFKLNNRVTIIQSYAFHKCNIQNIVLESDDLVLENSAFLNSYVQYIDIRKSVFSIGVDCFMDCAELKTIKYYASRSAWSGIRKETGWYSLPKSTILNKVLTLNKKKLLCIECKDGIVSEIAAEHK